MAKYETLGSMMRYHDRLKVACACGHKGDFSQAEAYALFGEDATPFDIRRRMRCSQCHKIGNVEVTI